MREIILDTETTGLDANGADRVVEIGCVELINGIASERSFHCYINPERDMPRGAFEVHGLSVEFLSDKPVFAGVADDFLAFIDGARLVIHNAAFDVGFLNAELKRLGRPALTWDRVEDTLLLARRKHPGAQNSLDALCKRYEIDNRSREKHGALLDAELLAEVYIQLRGGRQARLELAQGGGQVDVTVVASNAPVQRRPQPLPSRLTAQEISAHRAFVANLGKSALWLCYMENGDTPPV